LQVPQRRKVNVFAVSFTGQTKNCKLSLYVTDRHTFVTSIISSITDIVLTFASVALIITTVRPQLGVIEYDDGRQISVADLPGLVEGAYLNVGMGHNFLKHVERTYLLLFIIDVTGFKLNVTSPFRSAFDTFLLLTKEIELYMPELLDKPCVVCLNKMDMAKSKACLRSFMDSFNGLYEKGASDIGLPMEIRPSRIVKPLKLWAISAKKHDNIQPVVAHLREAIDQLDEEKRKLKTLDTNLLDIEDTGPLLL
ncbi:hypothetical protein D918_01496, partial [Trichuris suis]